jgi:hypothetical protein
MTAVIAAARRLARTGDTVLLAPRVRPSTSSAVTPNAGTLSQAAVRAFRVTR